MKKILFTTVIILVTANANAQAGMPQELTCTEKAFNFSFSLGTKWKLGAPKMGPAELKRDGLGYIPAWPLKHNNVPPETHLSPLFATPLNVEATIYPDNRQNHASLFHNDGFLAMDKSQYLLPVINLSLPNQLPLPVQTASSGKAVPKTAENSSP